MGKKEKNHAWVTRMLLTKLRHKKETYRRNRQEQGSVTLEEYRDTIPASRDHIRKGKTHMELNLVRDVKGNKKASASVSAAKGR